MVLNGFRAGEDLTPWRTLLAEVEHDELRLPEPVLDLAAYREAARRVPARTYCFVNSHSEPLVDGWLAKLLAALARPGVGLAGATGSWASARSLMAHVLRLPSPYRGVLPDPRATIAAFGEIEAQRTGAPPVAVAQRGALATAVARARTLVEAPAKMLPYAPFPAAHIRTNAFAISAPVLERVHMRALREKADAHLLESGRRSITRQVQRSGLRAVLVDRDGIAHDEDDWPRSRTFWQGAQEGLLVRDNQTRCYEEADARRRRLLAGFAWGRQADPA